MVVHTLVSKSKFYPMISMVYIIENHFLVTLSLNTSLHTHAQTLFLLDLERATLNLPLKLISLGRTLLRGSLYQVERDFAPMQRESLIVSCGPPPSNLILWFGRRVLVCGRSFGWRRRGHHCHLCTTMYLCVLF